MTARHSISGTFPLCTGAIIITGTAHFRLQALAVLGLLLLAPATFAHDISGNAEHPLYDWSVRPPGFDGQPIRLLAQAGVPQLSSPSPASATLNQPAPMQAAPFTAFAPKVGVRWDKDYLYVESNGLPSHNMMVGISAWQQQVPLPQSYFGDNAWRIPLHPAVAKQPASIRGRFLRGAIALAANGIPIFNPQNNRGEISQEIGELDQWGGHCGRADDYHYHAAPLHLQTVVGKGLPIAYALDGYPIYGLTEPDGSALTKLDEYNGHADAGGSYHYHGSTKYPYVNGGFHGEVIERDGQVDPQPKASPIRDGGQPLRGASITAFEITGSNTYKLSYEVAGDKRAIIYRVNADGTFPFEYWSGGRATSTQTYTRRPGGGAGPERPREPGNTGPAGGQRGGPGEADRGRREPPGEAGPNGRKPPPQELSNALPATKLISSFVLSSPAVINGGAFPVEFTGDGAGSTPPLTWQGAPPGTKSYALIMHHLDPEGKIKLYWMLFNVPAEANHLDKNAAISSAPGLNSIQSIVSYAPPHSKGPGPKTYVMTLYALSEMLPVNGPAGPVNAQTLVAAINQRLLATSDLNVVYSSRNE